MNLERLIGHLTFMSLVRRESLAVFDTVFSFCRRHYEQEHELWSSARRELEFWDGISPLLYRDLAECLEHLFDCGGCLALGLGGL